jgi:hypothetical protein
MLHLELHNIPCLKPRCIPSYNRYYSASPVNLQYLETKTVRFCVDDWHNLYVNARSREHTRIFQEHLAYAYTQTAIQILDLCGSEDNTSLSSGSGEIGHLAT